MYPLLSLPGAWGRAPKTTPENAIMLNSPRLVKRSQALRGRNPDKG